MWITLEEGLRNTSNLAISSICLSLSHSPCRRVYISYLDSVHFFQPRHLRTGVYHEILIGYLEYVKKMGFVTGHIWACPPSEGDDYIFHCHPSDQKIPKPKRLQEWYKKMLDKAVADRIIHDYKVLWQLYFWVTIKKVSDLSQRTEL